jgi:predicted metal-dependent hydrolase
MRRLAARRKHRRQLARRELLRIDGKPVAVTVRLNPRARRMIVKVHPSTGEVSVVAPSRHGLNHALDFARSERDWIAKRLEHVPPPVAAGPRRADSVSRRDCTSSARARRAARRCGSSADGEERIIRVCGETEHVPRRVLDFLKREARQQLDARVVHYSGLLEIKPRRITVRDTASRWGSCSTGRSLSFSWRLILAPFRARLRRGA